MLVSDTVLSIKVRRELQSEPDMDGVRVHVLDGVVTLEGQVSDERRKSRAEQLAEGVFGVEEVDNRLSVR